MPRYSIKALVLFVVFWTVVGVSPARLPASILLPFSVAQEVQHVFQLGVILRASLLVLRRDLLQGEPTVHRFDAENPCTAQSSSNQMDW